MQKIAEPHIGTLQALVVPRVWRPGPPAAGLCLRWVPSGSSPNDDWVRSLSTDLQCNSDRRPEIT